MSTRGKTLFADNSLTIVINQREQSMMEKIDGIPRKELDDKALEDWCDELESQFRIEVPKLNEDEKKVSATDVKVSSSGVGSVLFGGGEKVDGVEHRVDIPFDGDAELFYCQPSISGSRSSPPAIIEENYLSLVYVTTDNNEERLNSEQKKDLITIRKSLKRVGREVSEFNQSLREKILNRINRRRTKDPSDKKISAPADTAPKKPSKASPSEHPYLQSPQFGFTPDSEKEVKEEPKPEAPTPASEEPAPYVPAPLPTRDEPVIKYIVDLDLFSYSDISSNLEQSLGARAVQVLNQQIQNFVNKALQKVGAWIDQVPMVKTGDGAILAFDSAMVAARFAENIHLAADEHNEGKSVEVARRHFRVGVSKGEIIIEQEYTPSGELRSYNMAGTPIATAVRLESSCRTGEVLICANTYADLPEEIRSQYGAEESVKGKRQETFLAHRRKVVEPAPGK